MPQAEANRGILNGRKRQQNDLAVAADPALDALYQRECAVLANI
jgi:hypothetical protein